VKRECKNENLPTLKRFFLTKAFFLFMLLLIYNSSFIYSQTDTIQTPNKTGKKKETIKKGWNFGGIPILSFDSDLGFQFGALAGIYNYGDGKRYPKYDDYIYAEVSFYTKGSALFRLYYENDQLIKNIRITADLTYLPDQLYDFYGFNGYESVYNADWIEDSTKIFYKIHQNMLRLMANFQGNINSQKIRWFAGIDFYMLKIDNVNIDRLNKNKSPENLIPSLDSMPGLYDRYKQWGLISEDEAYGGNYTALKLGVIFDTRDNEPNPGRGIWSEIILTGTPKFLSNMKTGFLKISITHRQYFTLIKRHLTFAYRLGFITTIAGKSPWYSQNRLYPTILRSSSSEGLGGARTIRGILRNRVVGKGMGWGNFEFRWKIWQTVIFNQNIYFALSAFYDTGSALIKMEQNLINDLPEDIKSVYFTDNESFHNAIGGGFHIAMNENMMLSIDFGKALNKNDGNYGIYIGMGYLF
jgi:hypothetical protein